MAGLKDDSDKLRWDLLPFEQVEWVVKCLTRGAKTYDERAGVKENWKNVQDPKARYFAAAMRHLSAWKTGTDNDADSGFPHLAHAICNLLFLLYFSTLPNKEEA